MAMPDQDIPTKPYVVVARFGSSAHLRQGDSLAFEGRGLVGTGAVVVRTRYIDRGFEFPVPGDLMIEVHGPARSIDEAASRYANLGLDFVPAIAGAANAAIDPIDVELVFDVDPDSTDHDFRQYILEDEPLIPRRQARAIDTAPLLSFMGKVSEHPEGEIINRAINHYRIALSNWRFGHEILVVEALSKGFEALTEVEVAQRRAHMGATKQDLARLLGISEVVLDRAWCARCQGRAQEQWQYEFDSAVRREWLFGGDTECYESMMRGVRGPLTHGYKPFDKIYPIAEKIRDTAARYLREAIFRLADLDEPSMQILLSPRYRMPLGPWPSAGYVSGRLHGPGDHLAAEGQAYPRLVPTGRITGVSMTDDRRTRVEADYDFTRIFGAGVQFTPNQRTPLEKGLDTG